MSKKLIYALTLSGVGTVNPNVLHDALLADATYLTWKGTVDADGVYEDSLLYVEHDDTNIYLTVPDATNESTLETKVDAQRV